MSGNVYNEGLRSSEHALTMVLLSSEIRKKDLTSIQEESGMQGRE